MCYLKPTGKNQWRCCQRLFIKYFIAAGQVGIGFTCINVQWKMVEYIICRDGGTLELTTDKELSRYYGVYSSPSLQVAVNWLCQIRENKINIAQKRKKYLLNTLKGKYGDMRKRKKKGDKAVEMAVEIAENFSVKMSKALASQSRKQDKALAKSLRKNIP